ncbi:hypothetical protein [Dietzia aerolata]|uniref:Uncharacterized protein n=2 Tax=Dietzia aerolata TaxID=595984 RepID=A0ABV5JTB8_9ACTN
MYKPPTPQEAAAMALQQHALAVSGARYRGPTLDWPTSAPPAPLNPADFPAVDAAAVEAANAGVYNAIAEIIFG